jgi:hypothetical protein
MSMISKFSMIICLILLSLILNYSESNAIYDPSYCDEGDTTAWTGPITLIGMGLPPGVIGCSDSNCIVTVKFYERNIPGWGYEFQVAEISFQKLRLCLYGKSLESCNVDDSSCKKKSNGTS